MLSEIKRCRVQLESRKRELFDYDWRFHRGDIKEAQSPKVEDKNWKSINLPHDWSIEGEFSKDEPTGGSGAYLPAGIGWYRKKFKVDKDAENSLVWVEFDGVMLNSTIWINGHEVGNRPYGYSSFYYDISKFIKYGDENLIAVKVDSEHQPCSRWYEGCGIYRHTYLTILSPEHIAHWGSKVVIGKLTNQVCELEIESEICNETTKDISVDLNCEILDESDLCVGSVISKIEITSGTKKKIRQYITLKNPKLWNLRTPYLYKVHTILRDNDIVMDDDGIAVGLRIFGYDINNGFTINGEKIKIQGLCMHHDAGCVGAAIPERVMLRRLKKLKKAGCNGIRLSHYPHSPEMLDMLDSLGFVAIGEAFDEWKIGRPKTAEVGTDGLPGECDYGYCEYFDEWADQDLRDMIQRDRNHPSIAFWSIGNEIPEQCKPQGGEMAQHLVAVCHEMDNTRPVTSACMDTSGLGENTCTDEYMTALDIIGINYVDHWGDMKETYYYPLHEKFPDRILMGTEHVSVGSIRGSYDLYHHINQWYTMYYNNMIDIEQRHKFLKMHPYVLGDFMWTGADYLGEAAWPWKTPCTGMLDTCGFEKDGYYCLKSIWQSEETVLHLLPHWNWEGHEKEAIPVICYTNCEYVELFLNGQSYGKKCWQFPRPGMNHHFFHFDVPVLEITTADLHLSWNIPYEKGELKAVGYRDGKVVAEEVIRTAENAKQLRITTDVKEIEADGQDVVHCEIEVIDENGVLVPEADTPIEVEVNGSGHLLGMDNGSPFIEDGYKTNRKKTFNGKLLALIQSTKQTGIITVKVKSMFGEEIIEIQAI